MIDPTLALTTLTFSVTATLQGVVVLGLLALWLRDRSPTTIRAAVVVGTLAMIDAAQIVLKEGPDRSGDLAGIAIIAATMLFLASTVRLAGDTEHSEETLYRSIGRVVLGLGAVLLTVLVLTRPETGYPRGEWFRAVGNPWSRVVVAICVMLATWGIAHAWFRSRRTGVLVLGLGFACGVIRVMNIDRIYDDTLATTGPAEAALALLVVLSATGVAVGAVMITREERRDPGSTTSTAPG